MTLKSTKKQAGKAGAYIATLLYLVVTVSCAFLCYALYSRDKQAACISAGVVMLVILILVAMNNLLSWYTYATLEENFGSLFYTVVEPVDSVGKTCYTIKSVERIEKLKGQRLRVHGDIDVKEPMRKTKQIKSVDIADYTDEAYELVEKRIVK